MLTLRPFRAQLAMFAILLLVAVTVSGCARKIVLPCPNVRVDSATASLTKFKDGPVNAQGGREVSDIEYQADIAGYKGTCEYDDDNVEVTFSVDFTVTGGAAAKGGSAPLYYFVAIPQFFPAENGKRIMKTTHKLPARAGTRESFSESGLSVTIPIKKDQAGASYDIYIGFQLDAAQIDYNRSKTIR